MTISQFMNRALRGGYVFQHSDRTSIEEAVGYAVLEPSYTLLDPLSWKAVGEVEGWDDGKHPDATYAFASAQTWMWQWKIHRFIDHLCDGLPLEEALEKATS